MYKLNDLTRLIQKITLLIYTITLPGILIYNILEKQYMEVLIYPCLYVLLLCVNKFFK